MATIKRSIEINAPLEKVFDFVSTPDNWTRYVTSLIAVENLSDSVIKPETTFDWTYRMLGTDFRGKGKVLEYEKNKKFTMRMEGNFPITETYLFDGDDNKTTLTVEIVYELPGKLLGVLADKMVVEKLNIKEADTVLDKVKTLCEET
jgi:ligand-binding SRPBCC domain-containing protein